MHSFDWKLYFLSVLIVLVVVGSVLTTPIQKKKKIVDSSEEDTEHEKTSSEELIEYSKSIAPKGRTPKPKYMEIEYDNTGRKDNPDERGIYKGGDMRFAPSVRSGAVNTRLRWADRKVIYQFSPTWNDNDKSIVLAAMEEIATKTCIRFIPRTHLYQYDYVYILNTEDGCYSYVGKIGGMQKLNLGFGCVTQGIAVHELVHAIGFEHEQSRPDRDLFVKVNWPNVQELTVRNFEKFPISRVGPFGVPYDFNSIMHYSAYAFAANFKKPTLIPVSPSIPITVLGQRKGLSAGDIKKIKNLYTC